MIFIMSRTRRNFSAKFKSELVIELLKGEKDFNRTSVYYKGTPISQEELDCKSIIDRLHTDNPAWGARQLSAQLKKRGPLSFSTQ